MNILFVFFICSAVVFSLINGDGGQIFSIITDSLSESSALIIKIAFLTSFFSGIMKLAEKSGITDILCGAVKKLILVIFKTKSNEAKNKIALNISANILGIGNAATPAGLMAIKELDRENKNRERPSRDMCKLMAFNTCSVQLIPTTVISLRAAAQSENPTAVILPVIIVSLSSLIFSLLLLKMLYREEKEV